MKADFSHPILASPVFHARRLSILPAAGHTILYQESGGQPDIYRRIGIIAPILTQRQEELLTQKDRVFCNARLHNAAGCGPPRGDL